MPVVDVKVRPGSSVGPEHRYGCFNRPECKEMAENSQGCKHAGSGEAWIESNLNAGAK